MSVWDELDEAFNNRLTNKTRVMSKKNAKYCPRCRATKSTDDFSVSKGISPISYRPFKSYQPYCRPCFKIYKAKNKKNKKIVRPANES